MTSYRNDEIYDNVNHPKHYKTHPSGVECIQITEHMNFCLGNAQKYVWRAGIKSDNALEDLKKAAWYLAREIARLEQEANLPTNKVVPWGSTPKC